MSKVNEDFWKCVVQVVTRAGVDPLSCASWDHMAGVAAVALGGRCCVCARPSHRIGMYIPNDTSLLGGAGKRLLYLACASHTLAEVENLAATMAVTS